MKYCLLIFIIHRKQRSLDETTHETCDVILRCGKSASVPVHSCVLAAVSRFFRRLLSGQAIKRAGHDNLAVGIAGGALDVVSSLSGIISCAWKVFSFSYTSVSYIYCCSLSGRWRSFSCRIP